MRDFEDKTKAFVGFKAKVFLKVEGQCTEAMKGRIIRLRKYEAANTEKNGFAQSLREFKLESNVGATRLSLLSMHDFDGVL